MRSTCLLCYNIAMINRFISFFSLLAALILLLMMVFTTPSGVGPVGVLVFFTMIYVVLFGIMTVVVKIFMKISGKKKLFFKDYLYAGILAFGPILLILLQSFGSLSVFTFPLVVIAVAATCFVVNKRL